MEMADRNEWGLERANNLELIDIREMKQATSQEESILMRKAAVTRSQVKL